MSTHLNNQDDQRVRRAWELLDPLRGVEVPPMEVTAAQLRRRAEQHHHGPLNLWWWHQRALMSRRRIATLMTGAVALVVAAGAAIFTFALASPAVAGPAPLVMDTGDASPSAQAWLTATAAGLPVADTASQRPNTYIRLQRWAMDTTNPKLDLYAYDLRLWWRPDRSAVTADTPLPAQPKGKTTAQWLLGPPANATSEVIHHPSGSYSLLVDEPAADPAALRLQLETQEPSSNGPQATLRSLAAFVQFHCLNPRQRGAMLTVLAGVEGLRWRGATTDRAGRRGFAVTIDSASGVSGSVRDVLVLSPRGEVLSHELITLSPPAGVSVPRYTVTSYTLYLESERTFDFGP